MKLKVGIIDYGIGNWGSIKNSLSRLGFRTILSKNKNELKKSDLLFLPGVGAYKPAMKAILERGLDTLIYESANQKKPIIGICLGMQLLGRSSLEGDFTKGLNLIDEDVKPLKSDECHIGWNSIRLVKEDKYFNLNNDTEFYFNHSYGFSPETKYSVCITNFNSVNFTSIIRKDKIVGLQFHPEKSQIPGLKFLKELIFNFFE